MSTLPDGFLDYCENGINFVLRAKNKDYLAGCLDSKNQNTRLVAPNYFLKCPCCRNEILFKTSQELPKKSLRCKCGHYFILYTDEPEEANDPKTKIKFIMSNS